MGGGARDGGHPERARLREQELAPARGVIVAALLGALVWAALLLAGL